MLLVALAHLPRLHLLDGQRRLVFLSFAAHVSIILYRRGLSRAKVNQNKLVAITHPYIGSIAYFVKVTLHAHLRQFFL